MREAGGRQRRSLVARAAATLCRFDPLNQRGIIWPKTGRRKPNAHIF